VAPVEFARELVVGAQDLVANAHPASLQSSQKTAAAKTSHFSLRPEAFTLAGAVAANAELQDALSRLALFADFKPADFDALLQIAREVTFQEGQRVVERGQVEVGLHVVVEGEVGVVFLDEELAILPRGSFFGEISCLLGEPAVADIIARSPLRCLVIPPDEVETLLLAHPRVALRMLKTEARRLKTTDEARA
jgi:CRP-like cAMP-binding protein